MKKSSGWTWGKKSRPRKSVKRSIEFTLLILQGVHSKGLLADEMRKSLRITNPKTGRTLAEDLLCTAEQHALRDSAKGRKIARLLPEFRELLEQIKRDAT